ncbi:MAG: nucleotidyltransferase family protein [Anaerolineales bacterium]|nr:nucleotidyltransferase family protein [Anaerolineales bacterium]MCB8992094.1 nucleotidyltransferase family protein [Ardenticatenaceae bacterium]MCB9005477.1 nucleotidyltransferase family protein [Ardenticatenaceae bacterium]
MNENDSVLLTESKRLLQNALPDLRHRYRVRHLWFFGSYVRDEQTAISDLDILVDFNTPPTLFQFVRLKDELSDLLGVPVDLVMKTALKPRIGEQILSESIPI